MPAATEEKEETFVESVEEKGQEEHKEEVHEEVKKEEQKPDEMRQAMAELASTVEKALKPKEVTPELTEEQKAEFWAIYDPEKVQKDFYRKWFRLNPEATVEEVTEMKNMFADVHKGIVRQAVVGSRNVVANDLDKFREELKPVFDYVTSRKEKEKLADFHDTYPALSDKKYEKIVNLVAKGLNEKNFQTDDEYFKALADGAAETIKAAGVADFDLGKQPEKTAATTRRLPRTSAGSQGGSGGGKTEAKKEGAKSDDDFDSLKW